MATKKQPAKRNTRAGSRKNAKQPERVRNYRVEAIIYAACALISLLIIFVRGASVWSAIRAFFYGLFGVGIILVPAVLVYFTIITALEKQIAHFKTKLITCISIVMLTASAVYLISPEQYYFTDSSYFAALGKLFARAATHENFFECGGGLLSGIVGFPILLAFGKVAATAVVLIVIIALILIICRISLIDIGRAAKAVGEKVSRVSKKVPIHRRKVEPEAGDPDFNIDIPLDSYGKKKRTRRRSSIDIAIDDDSNPMKQDPEEKLIDSITKAGQVYVEPEKTEPEEISEEEAPEEVPEIVTVGESKPRRKRPAQKPAEPVKPVEHDTYKFPPVGLLKLADNSGKDQESEIRSNAKKLIETLESFGVKASITHISCGPSVTRYELRPAPGVKINKITNLADDIALGLAADGVRIEAPIPGKAAVGIEVPNKVKKFVSMRELIDSDEFEESKSKLTCVLGRDITGNMVLTDIATLPHLLIAGTTGSGKSVCVNSLLISILYKATPDEVKLVLIDPKMVEFTKYRGIPHLLIPVVTDAKKAAGALAWAVNEMQNRYKIFSEFECKDIDSYNRLVESNIEYMKDNPPVINEETGEEEQPVLEVNGLPVAKEKMSRIVIAIDEFADLMMSAPSEVEDSVVRLAQLARAAGMHLVIATQRPTANVFTGLIKANVPSRIALKVGSNMDSRITLDTGGAEKLIGKGDMLYLPVGAPNPIRVQGCFATEDEIAGVANYVKKSYTAQYNEEIEERIKKIAAEELVPEDDEGNSMGGIEVDSKMEEAIRIVIEAGQASTSMIQRRMKVGYARAGRMIDDMEQLGIVGPHQGSKPRDVIMTYSEWLERSNHLKD